MGVNKLHKPTNITRGPHIARIRYGYGKSNAKMMINIDQPSDFGVATQHGMATGLLAQIGTERRCFSRPRSEAHGENQGENHGENHGCCHGDITKI